MFFPKILSERLLIPKSIGIKKIAVNKIYSIKKDCLKLSNLSYLFYK